MGKIATKIARVNGLNSIRVRLNWIKCTSTLFPATRSSTGRMGVPELFIGTILNPVRVNSFSVDVITV